MNSKNSILLVDPDFDPAGGNDYTLLMKIAADSFSYAILDTESKRLQAVYDHQECTDVHATVLQKFRSDSYLTIPFSEIKASVYTECAIAIPNELFIEEALTDYAKFFPIAQSSNIYSQNSDIFGLKTIFTINDVLEEGINSSFGNCKVFEHSAPLARLATGSASIRLQIDFTAGSFNAVYVAGEKLIFQKYFETENLEEFNYYLLFMINQLSIDTTETEVFISGIIHQDDLYYACIAKYFKAIQFTNAKAMQTSNKILDDMPAHYYSSLLALDLCG